jgi:glycosyltransferase involved in cell wall biosynthesis
MNILYSIHLYPPQHNCGAEYMIHNIGKYLMAKGHHVRVLLLGAHHYKIKKVYEWEGVEVFPMGTDTAVRLYQWADVVFTHLDYTQYSIHMGSVYRKPVFHLIHNTHPYEPIIGADKPQFIVYNSEWAKNELGYKHESIVLHPPCDWRQYDTGQDSEKNEFITLINLDGNKGGDILRQIAEKMPERKFLGVKGSYSEPLDTGQYTNQPSNVTIMNNTPDIMPVYRQTRILIMPSKYESWGRTATEAMCSGIPVISSGTPGLRENCGDAGIYVDRNDIDGWIKAIKSLDKGYKQASKKAKDRSRELDPVKELDEFEKWIHGKG